MIGYTCKYAPMEIFEALGVEVEKIDTNATSYDKAESMMHANLCSYVKGVLEEVSKKEYEGVILTNCCDSTRRLYDTLKANFPNMFVYMLELPRKVNESAVSLYEESIMNMVDAYEEFKKCKFEREKLKEVVLSKKSEINNSNGGINVGIMGARCNDEIVKLVENSNGNIVFNITCTGDERVYDDINNDNFSINKYTECLLNKLPCVRMEDVNKRSEYIEKMRDKVQGIIYHTVKFCDIYSYEYAFLKDDIGIPLLKVETDYTKQCAGQIKTRVEAFIESLSVMNSGKAQNKSASLTLDGDKNNEVCRACYDQDGKADAEYKKRVQGLRDDLENESKSGIKDGKVKMNNGKVYVLGVDSGSTSTNAVIMDGDRNIVVSHVVRTGAKSKESARKVLDEVLEKANLKREDLSLIISTGYGRVSIDYADKGVTEISCHGRGAHYLNPEIRTIIDIGGQDSKVIKLNDKGEVTDFAMNDKCAAGTGRFLEMMARTLEINIKEMGPEALKWKEDISISSMCSVFAESEVISLIAENKEKCDIIHALCASIASKTNSLLNRVGRESKFMMTGGVAQNIGVVKAIEDKIGEELFISKEPEIVGAIGAALYALDELQ
ncbi:acyl-CoA dehydratase activase [Clostridium sp. SM-530-WT-3G]|uniref:acyl-CoA dehydratase activase n=1 Tax=Clostridium sp. SM-530-WT-3G TaxID=2725303 RepID=UPI00145DB7B8|nr:acyl-CoA dehydratase activase [Clostridium sp. SM-530-WT-3G]NME83457.1 3-hydroxyacyl-ACP dehydratase [Clostridium sp. SM-530-WT-3G]